MVQTKSRHHKTENSYRFQTLNERLANISVDVTKKINRFQQKPEETETYFYQCLEKWVDLNYTGVFHEFTNKIKSKCQTLALLIYHKDHLIETLKEFIARANELSLQPILDLTAQLARDLQSDYYFYFPDIFKSIIKLLDTQNTEILEWAFQTLSYLFKFLWRYMLKDLHTVYALYSPLFEESRKFYIRNFAAESFAFLMRKIPDKNELFDFLLTKRLIEHPQEISGIGRLIFEMFKGIKHQFNTCTGPSFQILLTKLNFFDNEQKNELIFRCIGKTVQSMADFTKKEHSSIVWTCFYIGIDDSVENKKKLTFILRLLEIFLESKNCYLVNNLDLLLDNMVKLAQIEIDSTQVSTDFTKHFFNLANLVLLSQNIKFPIEKINILPNKLYQVKFDCKLVSDLTRALFDYPFFETNIFPNLISYFDNQIKYKCHSKNQIETCFLTLLAEYLLKQKKILEPNYNTESLSEDKIENFIQIKGLTNLNRLFKSDKLFLDSELAKHLDEFLKNEIKNIENVELIIKILISNFIVGNSSNFDNLNQVANKLMETLEQEMNMDNFEDKNLTNFELNCYLLSLTIWSLSICTKVSCQKSIVDLVLKLNEAKNNLKLKQIVSYDVDAIDLSSKHLLQALRYSYDNENEFDPLRTLAGHLRSELSSPFSECRINSLFLLSALLKHSGLAVNDDNENLLDQCLKIELTPASLDEYRQKIYYLQKLDPLVSKKLVDNELTEEVPLRYIFGLLYENFKLFWDPTVQMIVTYANSMKQNDFWNIFYDFLVDLTHKIESKAQACRRSENTEKKADQFDLIKYLDKSRLGNVESIDYMNNRILLCKSMQSFAQICESKTKVLVPLFFRFMK
ncbi:small subunit processome component 20 -like protein [Brachionus plicatilis]|uniref:Small subunit processome component 20-like protein n=1 Tax=Brachionus plicatilis TaxID=10195 RepID=A0A3M7R7Q7_BRAPC|nr:small subunit processome component 20 -like protein [Brachionus plicatilis]